MHRFFTMCSRVNHASASEIPQTTRLMKLREQGRRIRQEAHVFYFAFKDPRMPWYGRLVAACTVGYLLSPIQLIPSFIPGIGFMDDFLVLALGLKLLRKITPPDVLTECRKLAESDDRRRQKETRPAVLAAIPVAIAAVWLLLTVTVSAVMTAYITR